MPQVTKVWVCAGREHRSQSVVFLKELPAQHLSQLLTLSPSNNLIRVLSAQIPQPGLTSNLGIEVSRLDSKQDWTREQRCHLFLVFKNSSHLKPGAILPPGVSGYVMFLKGLYSATLTQGQGAVCPGMGFSEAELSPVGSWLSKVSVLGGGTLLLSLGPGPSGEP